MWGLVHAQVASNATTRTTGSLRFHLGCDGPFDLDRIVAFGSDPFQAWGDSDWVPLQPLAGRKTGMKRMGTRAGASPY